VKSALLARVEALDGAMLEAFSGMLSAYLDQAGSDAVLVRPDRYVFGTGSAAAVANAYGLSIGDRHVA
jgi:3-(3-hydroxy-phenyl)propionate hydroxylase